MDDHKNGTQSGQGPGKVDTEELEHQPGNLGQEVEGKDTGLRLAMSPVFVAGRVIGPN